MLFFIVASPNVSEVSWTGIFTWWMVPCAWFGPKTVRTTHSHRYFEREHDTMNTHYGHRCCIGCLFICWVFFLFEPFNFGLFVSFAIAVFVSGWHRKAKVYQWISIKMDRESNVVSFYVDVRFTWMSFWCGGNSTHKCVPCTIATYYLSMCEHFAITYHVQML